MTKPDTQRRRKAENILAIAMVSSVVTSILALFTLLIANLFGLSELPVIFIQIAWFGLPLGALLLIALVATSAFNKSRE
jgi:TctA family transporter